jgi:hypothetical protein
MLSEITFSMLEDLIEKLGYESAGRVKTYLLLPRKQINKQGFKHIKDNNDTSCIRGFVREGHRYVMFYLDHENTMCANDWGKDDVVDNPVANLPLVLSPLKGIRGVSWERA